MTIVKHITQCLESRGETFKGVIEDYVRRMHGAMGDTVSRRLREMTDSGFIIKGTKDGNTTYKLKPKPAFKIVRISPTEVRIIQEELL